MHYRLLSIVVMINGNEQCFLSFRFFEVKIEKIITLDARLGLVVCMYSQSQFNLVDFPHDEVWMGEVEFQQYGIER